MRWILAAAAGLAMTTAPASAAQMGHYGIAGISVPVKDEAKAKLFYSHLGMKVGRLHHPGQQEMAYENPNQGPPLILMSLDKTVMPVSILMFVPSVGATVDELHQAGFKDVANPKPATGRIQELVIADPDGNKILLIGPAPAK